MSALRKAAGRIGTKRALAGVSLALSLGSLLLATEVPADLVPAGGSTALAELIARSPGARIGGMALKSKKRRLAVSPVASSNSPAAEEAAPQNAFASVLGASAGPEGGVPTNVPSGTGGFPSDFIAPGVPGAATPGIGTTPEAPAPVFGSIPLPSGGGGSVIIPGVGGGSGGGGSGGGGSIGGTGPAPGGPGTTPGGGGVVAPPVPPNVGPVPEPDTWLMLIAGFGVIGGALRRGRRVAVA